MNDEGPTKPRGRTGPEGYLPPKPWDQDPVALNLIARLYRSGSELAEIVRVLRKQKMTSKNGGELRQDVFRKYLMRKLGLRERVPREEILGRLDRIEVPLSPEGSAELEKMLAIVSRNKFDNAPVESPQKEPVRLTPTDVETLRKINADILRVSSDYAGTGYWRDDEHARLMLAVVLGESKDYDFKTAAATLAMLGYTAEDGGEIQDTHIAALMRPNGLASALDRRTTRQLIEERVGPLPVEQPADLVYKAAMLRTLLRSRAAILAKT